MYQYIFYLISRFAKKYNKDDFAFTAILYLILLMSFNVISIILLVKDKGYFQSHTAMIVFVSVTIPAIINYLNTPLQNGWFFYALKLNNYETKHRQTHTVSPTPLMNYSLNC
jgi:hypothetical protein